MTLWDTFLNTLFPSPFTSQELSRIAHADQVVHPWIFARFDYHTPQGKKLIYTIKKYQHRSLNINIAELLYEHIKDYISDQQTLSYYTDPLIIPVPLTRKQKALRGFNQVESIARHLAKLNQGHYNKDILMRTGSPRKQALIKNRKERFNNVLNTFSVKNTNIIQNKDIIIVDDLVTSGATLHEIKKVLQKHGARNIIGLTVAH